MFGSTASTEKKPRLYLFFGNDELAMHKLVQGLVDKVMDVAMGDMNISRFQESPRVEDVHDAAYMIPMFGDRRLVLLTNAQDWVKGSKNKDSILKLLDDYFFETFVPEAFNSSNYPWFRVLPAEPPVKRTINIEKRVDARTRILPFEIASEYISSAQYIAVGDCACRDHAAMQDGKPRCDKPKDVCLVFDRVAEYWVEKGIGRRITHEEAVNVLQRSAEAGLVHCTTNNRVFGEQMSGMICNCCPCCCFILQGVLRTRGQQGIAKSNFQPVIKNEECNLCMTCVYKCPVNALYHHKPHNDDYSDNFIALNESECLGCGVCVMACENEAIRLVKVRDTVPELDVLHMGDRHNKERRH